MGNQQQQKRKDSAETMVAEAGPKLFMVPAVLGMSLAGRREGGEGEEREREGHACVRPRQKAMQSAAKTALLI